MARIDDILTRLKRLHPLSIDLSLDRIERLLVRLGRPERRLPPVIHIAGTNGKGSVTAFLRAMLEADHRRVHVYTSPHLVRFNERIVLAKAGPDGRSGPIAEDRLADLLERVEAVNDGAAITFFEITTAAAFLAFAETPADAVLLEVGLGGRLDTTNVVPRPEVCVITSISMDHTERLGPTLARIATEKGGILKPGVTAVVARQDEAADRVIEARAAEVRAPLVRAGREFDAFRQNGRLVFQREDRLLDLPLPALIGRHQIGNAGVAVASALEAKALSLSEAAIAEGLIAVRWPARMQRLTAGPLPDLLGPGSEIWLDGGHNPAGGVALAETIADLEERSPRALWLIVGMMGQKDVSGFLGAFRGLAERVLTVPVPGAHEAPATPERLAVIAREVGHTAEPAASVEAALKRVRAMARGPVRVLICGSLYLAGHVLALQEGASVQTN
ncbi:MAG: folylpolyglutamate synthase/dihydrofolate synthase family protein [Hyphomicrobiaceae bacterium]|nr:folylpolyglutamate synthase/dihydrofolate synthase family protein [Hyphomicrobiaceae bacterium]